MPRAPQGFEGRPLPDLLQELAREGPEALLAAWEQNETHPTPPVRGAMLDPTVEWRTTWLMPAAADTYLPPDHPPVTVPDVTLEALIGSGRQGLVYSGRVRSSGLIVAVKVLHGDDDGAGRRALREARAANKLAHRNVLRVFQVQRAGAFWVVVMEFLQGADLARSPVPEVGARACFGRLADAVRALGRARVVHRDIKPANVVLRSGDRAPVLVDFGLAFDLDEPDDSAGLICGTPLFMAPEAFSGAVPSNAWDGYSLGMTAAAALLGDRCPRGSGLPDLIRTKVSGSFDATVGEALGALRDAAVREWCRMLLSREPANRSAALGTAIRWLPE